MPRGYSRYDEASLQQRLWTPDLLRPNLSFWQDAADTSTITIQTGVSQWRDKSGNGRNFIQNTAGNQPTYSEREFLGRPGITFDGATDDLRLTSIASLIGNQTHGLYWVFFRRGAGTGSDAYRPSISVWPSNGSADMGALHYVKNNNNLGASYPYFANPGSHSYDLSSGTAYANLVPNIMAFQSNVTGWGVWRSGTLEGTTNGISTPNSNNAGYVLGKQINVFRVSSITIGEVMMVQNVNTRVRQIIEGYLAWKWGMVDRLASSHPFINRPPLIGD